MKKIKPVLKFNGGAGAILCVECSIIIKQNLTEDEWNGKTNLLYCDSCLKKIRKKKIQTLNKK